MSGNKHSMWKWLAILGSMVMSTMYIIKFTFDHLKLTLIGGIKDNQMATSETPKVPIWVVSHLR